MARSPARAVTAAGKLKRALTSRVTVRSLDFTPAEEDAVRDGLAAIGLV